MQRTHLILISIFFLSCTESKFKSKIELGKALFQDTRLSKNNTISCASCHKQTFAFGDNQVVSLGIYDSLGKRNTPPLFNLSERSKFMRAGEVISLEKQMLVPVTDPNEMHGDFKEILPLLSKDNHYQKASKILFNRDFDLFTLGRALSSYQNSLESYNSPFDKDSISAKKTKGYKLYKTHCSSCHNGKNFRSDKLASHGLKSNDLGAYRKSRKEKDKFLFMVPTLRNLEFTAPYMHNGSIPTIDSVLRHFNENQLKSDPLSRDDLENIKAFLYTLSDYEFIQSQ